MFISTDLWKKLPIKLRQRFWRETDYGRIEPNEDLKKDIKEYENDDVDRKTL